MIGKPPHQRSRHGKKLLGQGFAFPLQQTVPGLGAFKFVFHRTQRLPGGEDSFPILFCKMVQHQAWQTGGVENRMPYSCARHLEQLLDTWTLSGRTGEEVTRLRLLDSTSACGPSSSIDVTKSRLKFIGRSCRHSPV